MTTLHERIETTLPIDDDLRLRRRLRERPGMGPGRRDRRATRCRAGRASGRAIASASGSAAGSRRWSTGSPSSSRRPASSWSVPDRACRPSTTSASSAIAAGTRVDYTADIRLGGVAAAHPAVPRSRLRDHRTQRRRRHAADPRRPGGGRRRRRRRAGSRHEGRHRRRRDQRPDRGLCPPPGARHPAVRCRCGRRRSRQDGRRRDRRRAGRRRHRVHRLQRAHLPDLRAAARRARRRDAAERHVAGLDLSRLRRRVQLARRPRLPGHARRRSPGPVTGG